MNNIIGFVAQAGGKAKELESAGGKAGKSIALGVGGGLGAVGAGVGIGIIVV